MRSPQICVLKEQLYLCVFGLEVSSLVSPIKDKYSRTAKGRKDTRPTTVDMRCKVKGMCNHCLT